MGAVVFRRLWDGECIVYIHVKVVLRSNFNRRVLAEAFPC